MEQEPKRLHQRNIWLIALTILFSSLLLMYIIVPCWIALSRAQVRRPDLERVSELTDIRFPNNAKLLGSYQCKGVLEAAVQFEKQDATRFCSYLQSEKGFSIFKSAVLETGGNYPTWWQPSQAKKQQSFQGPSDTQSPTTDVLIDMDHPERVTVYIRWFGN